MERSRFRDRLFFISYFVLLCGALGWTQLHSVRSHAGTDLALLRGVILAGMGYLALRAYVVTTRRVSVLLEWTWLALDLALITAIVRLSGGIRSDAALAYLIPVFIAAIELQPLMTVIIGVASSGLYVMATWHAGFSADEVGWLVTHLLFLAVTACLGAGFAAREKKRREEMLRLREQLALADYRTRLSQELHDGVQHYLVGAVVRLEMARKVAERDPVRAVQMAVDVRHTIRQAADELRYLVRRLRSSKVERHGFLQALREHLSLYADNAPFTVDLEVEAEDVSLSPEVEQTAFRIIQEALTNAEKHAQPSEVRVSLQLSDNDLDCVIADNGAGFDLATLPEQPDMADGLGLAGMKHRAASVGGTVELQSTPGQGTTVRLTIPLQGPAGPDGSQAQP